MNSLNRRIFGAAFAAAVSVMIPAAARANHGPGTSGGGSATASGETLKPGAFDLSLRTDYTKFEDISRAKAERLALRAGEFDAIDDAYITTFGVTYGVIEDLQVGAQVGYYWGNSFIEASSEDGVSSESSIADPEGLTDLNISIKYRLLKGQPGNLSVIGGVIAPTGNNNARLSDRDFLEPSSQPGTGAWAYQVGLAYSRFLTSMVTVDASAIYTIRTPNEGFEVGDRVDLGIAFAYRLTESIKAFPNFSIFGEANAVWIGKDESSDEGKNANSGGWIVYFTPGARVRFISNVSLTVAPSFPVVQELNGEQVESQFKLAATLSFSF